MRVPIKKNGQTYWQEVEVEEKSQHTLLGQNVCWECGTEITVAEREADDVREGDDGNEYHWACLQERYERDRLAKEDDDD